MIAALFLVLCVAVMVTAIVLLPAPTIEPLPPTLCRHDWRQVDELIDNGDTVHVMQACTRCPEARMIPLTTPRGTEC